MDGGFEGGFLQRLIVGWAARGAVPVDGGYVPSTGPVSRGGASRRILRRGARPPAPRDAARGVSCAPVRPFARAMAVRGLC